jgi:hypothetical protein
MKHFQMSYMGTLILLVWSSWLAYWVIAAAEVQSFDPLIRESILISVGLATGIALFLSEKKVKVITLVLATFLILIQCFFFYQEIGMEPYASLPQPIFRFVHDKSFAIRTAFSLDARVLGMELFMTYCLMPLLALMAFFCSILNFKKVYSRA